MVDFDALVRHVFTQRLLHARGRFETMFLGAGTMAPLIRSLVSIPAGLLKMRFRRFLIASTQEQVTPMLGMWAMIAAMNGALIRPTHKSVAGTTSEMR